MRPIDFTQRDRLFAGVDLRGEKFVELVQRRLVQVDRLGQIEIVKLAQMVAEHRVYLGQMRRGLKRKTVANALLLGQLDRQQQQGRNDPFLRRFLQVVPAQETDHQLELGEAILGPVALGFADDFLQQLRNVGRILKPDEPVERNDTLLRQQFRELLMPDEELLVLDVTVIEHRRNGGQREVHLMLGLLEVKQAVAPRNFEETIAQMALDHPALSGQAGFLETIDALEIEIVFGRLFAVVFKAANQRRQILRAVVPVQFRHLHNGRGHDRIQPGINREEVLAIVDENLEVIRIGEIETSRHAGENEAERKDIGQRIVLSRLVFPGQVAGQKPGLLDDRLRLAEFTPFHPNLILGKIDNEAPFVDHVDTACRVARPRQAKAEQFGPGRKGLIGGKEKHARFIRL